MLLEERKFIGIYPLLEERKFIGIYPLLEERKFIGIYTPPPPPPSVVIVVLDVCFFLFVRIMCTQLRFLRTGSYAPGLTYADVTSYVWFNC